MTDPAVEAAGRAVSLHYPPTITEPTACEIDSAREALKPIHKWYGKAMAEAIAEDLYEQQDLLESLAPLIFSTEELER